MITYYFVFLFNLFFLNFLSLASSVHILEKESGIISLQFSFEHYFDYQIEEKENFLKLIIPSLQEESVKILNSIQNSNVKVTKVEKNVMKEKDIIYFKLEKGTEYFEYIMQNHKRFVIDFFIKNQNPNLSTNNTEIIKKNDQQAHFNRYHNRSSQKNQNNQRSPASFSDVFIISNSDETFNEINQNTTNEVTKFDLIKKINPNEKNPDPELTFYLNDYVDFPYIRNNGELELRKILHSMPIYEINMNISSDVVQNDEKKYAKLLSILFNKKKYLSFIKAAKWFEKKYPNSYYKDVIISMWADSHLQYYIKDKKNNFNHLFLAKVRYDQIVNEFPEFKLNPRIYMLMSYIFLVEKDYLNSLRWFQRFIAKYPDYEGISKAYFGSVENLIELGKYNEVESLLNQIKEKICKSSELCLYEVELTRVDFLLKNKKYKEAMELFRFIEKNYSKFLNERFYFNFGELLFREKKLEESLEKFKLFIQKFPDHAHGGYAYTRIGEIFSILSANKDISLSYYLEGVFKYGNNRESPAIFSKIRVMEMQLPFLKSRSQLYVIDEILDLTKSSNIDFASDFGRFIVSNQLSNLGEFDRALELLIPIYREDYKHPLRHIYFKKIQQLYAKKIISKLESDPLGYLKEYDKLKHEWFKNSQRVDLLYAMAIAYFKLGDYKKSSEIMEHVINFIENLKTDYVFDRLKSRLEGYPQVGEVLFRNAINNYYLQDWVSLEQTLNRLEKYLNDLDVKTRNSYFLIKTISLVKQKKEDLALRYINDFKTIDVDNLEDRLILLDLEFQIYYDLKKYDSVIKLITHWEQLCLAEDPLSLCYSMMKKIIFSLNKTKLFKNHVNLVNKYLDRYSNKYDTDEERYYLFDLYLSENKIDEAKNLMVGFKRKNTSWDLIAQEQVNDFLFKKEVSNYFDQNSSTTLDRGIANE